MFLPLSLLAPLHPFTSSPAIRFIATAETMRTSRHAPQSLAVCISSSSCESALPPLPCLAADIHHTESIPPKPQFWGSGGQVQCREAGTCGRRRGAGRLAGLGKQAGKVEDASPPEGGHGPAAFRAHYLRRQPVPAAGPGAGPIQSQAPPNVA